jgi:hypothetical protein
MSYQLTREDILNSLKKDGKSVPNEQKESLLSLNGLANATEKYINKPLQNAGLPNLGAGILSAPPKLARNLINFPGAILNTVAGTHIPKAELPDWLNPSSSKNLGHSPMQNAMGAAGDLIGDVVTGGKAFNMLNKAAGVKATTSLAKRAALGAATGAGLSDSDQFGGRTLGGVLGGLAPLISGVSKSTIGKRAGELYSENKKDYKALYNKIFKEAEGMPIKDELSVPKKLQERTEDVKELFKNSKYKLGAGVKRFESNPTLKNAHDAQSDLGKIIRGFEERLKKGESLASGENTALKAARDMQKRIRGTMQQHFVKGGRQDLASEYGNTTQGYATKVAPLSGKSMSKYQAGEGSAKKVAKDLLANNKFAESELAKQIPGYGVKKAIHDIPTSVKLGVPPAVIFALSKLGVPIPYELRKLFGG